MPQQNVLRLLLCIPAIFAVALVAIQTISARLLLQNVDIVRSALRKSADDLASIAVLNSATLSNQLHETHWCLAQPNSTQECNDPLCGGELVVGILETWYLSWRGQTNRAKEQRQSIRSTWTRLPTPGFSRTILFVLAVNETGVPSEYIDEATLHRDMLFLRVYERHPVNLGEKVRLWFDWVGRSCKRVQYILKTNEDSFVHLPALASRLKTLPATGLVWGRLMGKAALWQGSNPRKKPYPNGCGYVVSADIGAHIGSPPLYAWERNVSEDDLLRMRLVGNVVHAIRGQSEFQSYGKCTEDSVLLHYQRHPALMKRRFDRALRNKSICGNGFTVGEICVRIANYGVSEVRCPENQVVQRVQHAAFGRVGKWEGPEFPWCQEDPKSVVLHDECFSPESQTVVKSLCVGKKNCTITADAKVFGKDPCRGGSKHFYGLFICGVAD